MRYDLLPTTYNGILIRLIEEASETIKAAAKIQRFGVIATDSKTGIKYDNVADLRSEINDLKHAIGEFEKLYE